MGRTLPSAVQLIDGQKEEWKLFRRALRAEDQDAFDALWRYCRYHAAPICMAGRPVPYDAMIMAMLVELGKRLATLEAKQGQNDNKADRRMDL